MAAPIPDNSYGGPIEEENRLFVAKRGDKFPRKSKRHSKRKKHRGAKRY